MDYRFLIKDKSGRQLEALQELPAKGDKFPTVILVPGFGVDLHEYGYFDEIARMLTRNGVAAVRFSFAGTGKSSGDFVRATVSDQAKQLQDVIEYVRRDRFTQKDRLGIMAHSLGGCVTLAAKPGEITTFAFSGFPADAHDYLSKRMKGQRSYNPQGISELERHDHTRTRIGPAFWQDLRRFNFVSSLTGVEIPTLLLQGSLDRATKPWVIEDIYNQIKSKKKLAIVKQADHSFSGKFRTVAVDILREWFTEVLI